MQIAFRQLYNNFAVLLGLIVIVAWSPASFAQSSFLNLNWFTGSRPDTAVTEPEQAPKVPPVSGLTADAIDLLQDNKDLPKISHLDDYYKTGRHRSICKQDWKRLRSKPVEVKAFEQNLAKIEAKARSMNIWGDHLKKTLATFKLNQNEIPNQDHISFINFNRRSSQKRFYIVNLRTGDIKSYHVAAGLGSDPDGNGYASKFSNNGKTQRSSLGCVLVGGKYTGKKNRPSLYLHGFSSTNDRSCNRSVVMHPAGYVGGIPGRSHGCPAVRNQDRKAVYNQVSGGGLLCSYQDGHEYEATHTKVKKKIKKIKKSKKKTYKKRISKSKKKVKRRSSR